MLVNVRQRKKLTARLTAALLRDDLPTVLALLRAGADPNAMRSLS